MSIQEHVNQVKANIAAAAQAAAAGAPLLDYSRAERELDFRPQWSSVQAMRDLLAGLFDGAGTASPPLKP